MRCLDCLHPVFGLAHDFATFLFFRVLIGAIGASFVITQYHTSQMFASRCVGTAIPLRCFSENYLVTNPQFGNITYHANLNNSYYHSMQAQFTARPINGEVPVRLM